MKRVSSGKHVSRSKLISEYEGFDEQPVNHRELRTMKFPYQAMTELTRQSPYTRVVEIKEHGYDQIRRRWTSKYRKEDEERVNTNLQERMGETSL